MRVYFRGPAPYDSLVTTRPLGRRYQRGEIKMLDEAEYTWWEVILITIVVLSWLSVGAWL